MTAPDTTPSATLAGILEHIRDGAESEITHPDDECGIEAGGFCTPHGALAAVAAVEAALKLADKWEADSFIVDPEIPLREAITTALTRQERSDGR